jgi:hypothetical protein
MSSVTEYVCSELIIGASPRKPQITNSLNAAPVTVCLLQM